jgi:hypothetical protein
MKDGLTVDGGGRSCLQARDQGARTPACRTDEALLSPSQQKTQGQESFGNHLQLTRKVGLGVSGREQQAGDRQQVQTQTERGQESLACCSHRSWDSLGGRGRSTEQHC